MEEGLFTVYRREVGEDGPREMAVRLKTTGVEIRSGRADETTALTRIAQRQCLGENPWRELQWRRNEWLRKGFRMVGYGEYVDDRVRLIQEAEPVPPDAEPKNQRLALHWSATGLFEVGQLEDTMLEIAKGLRGIGIGASAQSRYVEGWTGLSVETPNRTWKLRVQPTGLLTEAGQQAVAAELLAADGTAPFLVLLRIEQVFPGALEFVWLEQSDAWRVQPKLAPDDPYLGTAVGPFEKTLQVAEEVRLIPPPPLLAEGTESDPVPTWF